MMTQTLTEAKRATQDTGTADMLHSDPPDGFRRRASLTEPGRSILLCHDPFLGVINFGLFSELTGIGNEGLMASRMCPLPIPINGARPATPTVFSHPIQGRQQALHYPGRRVAGIRADAMWHPFLWLPPRLANRQSFQVDDSGGVTRITRRSNNINPNLKVFTESDDVWVIRVVLEVSASGLYDMESGTWLDILSMLDIDTMTDDGVDRVQRWLDGAEDADLDLLDTGLELEHHVTNDDNPNWALQSAVSLSPELRSCVWATGADSLLGMLDGMTDEIGCGATLDVEDAKFVASTVALLGSTWMGDLDRSSGHPHGDLESTWWNEIAKEIHDFEGGLGELVIGGLVDRLSDRLIEIREMFWPTVQPPSAHA